MALPRICTITLAFCVLLGVANAMFRAHLGIAGNWDFAALAFLAVVVGFFEWAERCARHDRRVG